MTFGICTCGVENFTANSCMVPDDNDYDNFTGGKTVFVAQLNSDYGTGLVIMRSRVHVPVAALSCLCH